MNTDTLKKTGWKILGKWWCSLLLLPFVFYTVHQMYWTLRFNIHFAISYNFPFPVNFINFLTDNFLLITHEAGHTFFSIFGSRTITVLGGSLFEILLPVIIFAYTWYNRKKIGMQFSLYLVGFAFLQVAYYAADAGARELPLIGGLSKESHDWSNLLSWWNILDHDITVGVILAAIAVICFVAALLVPAFFKTYEEVNLDIKM